MKGEVFCTFSLHLFKIKTFWLRMTARMKFASVFDVDLSFALLPGE